MKTFDDKQFTAYYNRLMLLTLCVVVLIAFALVGIQVRNQAKHDDAQLIEAFKTRSLAIDNLIVSVTEHLNVLQNKAESHFLDPVGGRSRLFAALVQTEPQRYSLDVIPGPYTQQDVGNLTGVGMLAQLSAATAEEMEMALSLNSLLQGIQQNIPNAAWVYYTSAQRFSNIYPWVASSTARFTEAFYRKPFYLVGLPEHNPQRQIRWTPLYVDEYGKGMMVTASKPVYRDGRFLGTVSIDITLDGLTPYVRDFAEGAGALMIVNETGELIAHPSATSASDTRIQRFQDLLPPPLGAAADHLFAAGSLKPARLQQHLVLWYGMQHAPWKVVYVAPEPGLLAKTLSRSGALFLVLLGALTVMLISMRMLTFREFILPAESLVRHIFMESENKAGALGRQPPQWMPWFAEVSRAFGQNRQLIAEINQKNQQLTDLNISLERYMPKFVLLVSLHPGSGATTVGNLFADTLARKGGSRSTVYLEYPQPEKLALDFGLDEAQPIYPHPNGYDLWTAYDLGQVPQAGVSSLLMAKVLNKYDNVVISATVQPPVEAFVDQLLEPMLRYAKAIVVLVPPDRAGDPAVRQLVKQLQRGVRQDQAHVYLVANHTRPDVPPASGVDFDVPCVGAEARLTKARYDCPPAMGAVIDKLVDRVERVHQIAAFIPSTTGVNQPIDNTAFVQRTLTYFSLRFGGATSSQAQGAWNSDKAGVVSEGVHLVVSYATEEDLSRHLDDVIDYLKQVKAELGQEAMALEINRKLILV